MVYQATAVDGRFETNGIMRPRRFTWQGIWYEVSDVGRQWVEDDGRHVLVMVAGRRVFELLLERETLSWHVVRAPTDVAAA